MKQNQFKKVLLLMTMFVGAHASWAAPAPAPTFTIDGDLTGIAHISTDGQMNLEEGAVYNLAGQRVSQPKKGMYIVNGKKIIIK